MRAVVSLALPLLAAGAAAQNVDFAGNRSLQLEGRLEEYWQSRSRF